MAGGIVREAGNFSSVESSPDITLVTLSDSANFSAFGDFVIPRGFFVTTDGNIKITTAKGTTLVLPVVANKDYLIQVTRFWSTSFTAGACYAFL